MESPDVIVVAEGRMLYEQFRGRGGKLLIRSPEGAYQPLAWYDTSLYVPEGQERPAEAPDGKQGEYAIDEERFRTVLEDALQARTDLKTLLLVDSYGGRIGTERLITTVTDQTRSRGGRVSAYVSTVAASAGSQIMMQADDIHLLRDTWCMWHLPAFPPDYRASLIEQLGEEKGEATLKRHNELRHAMHRERMEHLADRALPDYRSKIRADIERVMRGHGVRHEMSYSGGQLHTFGVAQEAYQQVAELERLVFERHGIKGCDAKWRSDAVSRFFLFSRIEEQLRETYGISLKLLLMPAGSLCLQCSTDDVSTFEPYRCEADAMVQRSLQGI